MVCSRKENRLHRDQPVACVGPTVTLTRALAISPQPNYCSRNPVRQRGRTRLLIRGWYHLDDRPSVSFGAGVDFDSGKLHRTRLFSQGTLKPNRRSMPQRSAGILPCSPPTAVTGFKPREHSSNFERRWYAEGERALVVRVESKIYR